MRYHRTSRTVHGLRKPCQPLAHHALAAAARNHCRVHACYNGCMARLRVSAISFLNTAPLMWDFENGVTADRLRAHFEISYTIPSRCAEELKLGLADIGIIPVAAYATIPGLMIVPDVAIVSKNAVRSILLISKVPLEKIRSVAVDASSRTSAALVEVFLTSSSASTQAFAAGAARWIPCSSGTMQGCSLAILRCWLIREAFTCTTLPSSGANGPEGRLSLPFGRCAKLLCRALRRN